MIGVETKFKRESKQIINFKIYVHLKRNDWDFLDVVFQIKWLKNPNITNCEQL